MFYGNVERLIFTYESSMKKLLSLPPNLVECFVA